MKPAGSNPNNSSVRFPFAAMQWLLAVVTGLVAGGLFVPQASFAAETPAITALRVQPDRILLNGANRRQQILVTGIVANGPEIDLTNQVTHLFAAPDIADVEETVVIGLQDGKTALSVAWEGLTTEVAVEVVGIAEFPPIHFENDIIPLLTKLGCNSGGCHGKASGQNGFKLSVFGFDPQTDHAALAKEGRGRRIFPSEPERSLLIQKGAALVPHGGGRRIEPGSTDEALLVEWVRQGIPWGQDNAPHLVRLEVQPLDCVLGKETPRQILATALFSDGSRRDVTDAAAYSSNAPLVADVLSPGQIHTGKVAGEAAITVNYRGKVAAIQVQIPRDHSADELRPFPVLNEIDRFVEIKLRKMGIPAASLADDATFLRRTFLTTIGMLPTAEEVQTFLADERKDKRARIIDELLNRDEFASFWALKWGDILLVDRNKLGDRGAFAFSNWLRDNFAHNRPYDVWVRELVTATGDSAKNGPVNFYRAQRTPDELARSVSQAFLGIRMDCAQCHHHPFERWGQDDFYGMAGFFNGLSFRTLDKSAGREIVYHAGYRETKMPLTGVPVATRPPGGEIPDHLNDGDPRQSLANWMTSPENPWFARLVANRLWKHYLGHGLVEPEDDLRSTNPATNEPLLNFLSEQVVATGYDLKQVMRLIMNSGVFQLSSEAVAGNADDVQNFSHYTVRRLPAEVLMDAVSDVTGVPEEFPGMPVGTRAIALWDNRFPSYFLEIFGRPDRETPCECGRSNEPTLAQALHLMNAPEVEAKVTSPGGRIAALLARNATPEEVATELCLTALGRLPNQRELETADRLFAQGAPREAAEDFLWALLNSYDFLFIK